MSDADLAAIFSENGVLADSFSGYRFRPQQLEMAEAVADAIQNYKILVAEAGTGTGKTFAYLIPVLMSKTKVIVSTGTKTLQDQLFNRDIPALRKLLNVPVSVALLKGRANYICHYHLERSASEGRFHSREDVKYLHLIKRHAGQSQTGDKNELTDIPEDATIWTHVTSTRDNCLGQECPSYGDCFVMSARKKAQQADIIVVNHHLFFADVMLRDEGMNELLPACNAVIFDEAHQVPEVASLFFSETTSTTQLLELARDSEAEALTAAKDFADLPEGIRVFEKAIRDFRLSFSENNTRLPYRAVAVLSGFKENLLILVEKLKSLGELLSSQAERSEGLNRCAFRAQEALVKLQRWQDETNDQVVRWVEIFNHGVHLNGTPLSIAETFQKQLTSTPRAWIFTSATLSVKRDFGHYNNEMGLLQAVTACWDSPFDFTNQALLYVPKGLPDPNTSEYTKAVVQAALPVLKASGGRAFLLFTSLRAMKLAHELIKEYFSEENLDYPLLLQGEGSKSELLERFRKLGNAVLLGSQSFWEGVDVRGEALSLVIIDKLPFAPPDDPVLAARIEQINKQGRNAFMEYQLPRAVINLKQGAGRLIRGETDRGVLMICDTRLIDKPYGKRIWQSLPPMTRTRELGKVEEFYKLG